MEYFALSDDLLTLSESISILIRILSETDRQNYYSRVSDVWGADSFALKPVFDT